jgi:hypothetical protein
VHWSNFIRSLSDSRVIHMLLLGILQRLVRLLE